MNRFLTFLVIGAIAVLAGSAKADIIYTLTYDSCSGGCGNGQGTNNNTFGYIDLHQVNATTVTLTETLTNYQQNLNDPNYFVNTGSGNHQPLAFNVDKSVNISNVTPSTYFTAGSGSVTISGLKTFSNFIACTSNCGSGASNASVIGQTLSFSTTDGTTLSVGDFVGNDSGYVFASDIIGGQTTNTGEVAALAGTGCNTATSTCAGYSSGGGSGSTPAPEPASLFLMGAGLAGIGVVRRRRAKRA